MKIIKIKQVEVFKKIFLHLILMFFFNCNLQASIVKEIDPTNILIYKYGFKKIKNQQEYLAENNQESIEIAEEIKQQNQENEGDIDESKTEEELIQNFENSSEKKEEKIESDIDNSGFYRGIDATKSDNRIGVIDKSIATNSRIAEDKYYGYKIGYEGVYISPEVFARQIAGQNKPQNQSSPASISQNQTVAYDLKANIGYDFNKYVSTFLSYDVARFAFDPNQKSVSIGDRNSTNSTVGVGSQINVSKRLGFKVIYSQQQFDNSQNNQGRVRSDIVRFGTVYSF